MDALAALTFLPMRLSRNPMAYTIDAVADSIGDRAGLSYLLSLKKPKAVGSGEYNELITLPGREFPKRNELGADVFPGAQFDVAVFIDDYLSRTVPHPQQKTIASCGDMTTSYYVRTRVENNGVLVPGTDLTMGLEYAMKGCLSVDQFAAWRDQFFTTYLSQSRQFLTWQPTEKWVDTVQPEFVYYLVNFTPKPTELRVRCEVTYADNSSETLTIQTFSSVGQYTVYSIPVGFVALGLPARETSTGKTVHGYKIWLANEASQRLSEVRIYYINREYEANTLYLVFANSLGGYDTLRCTGQSAKSITVKSTAAQRALDPNYLPTTAELFALNRLGEKTLIVNTGLQDGDAIDYLSEVVMSEEVYVVTKEGFVVLSLATSGDTVLSLRQDDEDLAGRSLTFRYAKNEVGFSDLPQAPVPLSRPTRWVPVNPFCVINENGIRTGYMGAAKLELYYSDDNTPVKPRRSKANAPGTEGYTPPVLSAVCSTTPFTNALISKQGTFRRNNCASDQEATTATLTIPAGMYGAETADQLQSRVDQALKVMDTQEYANQFGACLANPALYEYNVSANHFHYRGNKPDKLGLETTQPPYMGNAWSIQGQGGQYVFSPGSNDLDFPIGNLEQGAWRIFTYGTPGTPARLRLYKNGVLYRDDQFSFNPDGYEYHSFFGLARNGLTGYVSVSTGDKFYIQLT